MIEYLNNQYFSAARDPEDFPISKDQMPKLGESNLIIENTQATDLPEIQPGEAQLNEPLIILYNSCSNFIHHAPTLIFVRHNSDYKLTITTYIIDVIMLTLSMIC